MLAKIHITLKKDVLDPQGKVIANSLSDLGFDGIQSVRQGKYIEIILDGDEKMQLPRSLIKCAKNY